ncbi:ABC-type proline/glycine betaine transport system substrate-binding protein [Chitinophaga sp. OAE865]
MFFPGRPVITSYHRCKATGCDHRLGAALDVCPLSVVFPGRSGKVFGETEEVQTIANNEFSVSDTVAVNFFRKFRLNSGQLGSLMGALADADNKEVQP